MSFIKRIKGENKIILEKYQGENLNDGYLNEPISDDNNQINICFLDLETTGKNKDQDKIIEIAMKTIRIDKNNGDFIGVVDSYESFQDPGSPINPMATKFNGIKDEMVKDHSIDWTRVKEVYQKSDLAVAHNSYFDRAFMDRYIEHRIPWGCSLNDIDWLDRGFTNSKLELLCIWHGFFFEAHRAMNDVDALINLLIHDEYKENKPITELIQNARTPNYEVTLSFPYDREVIEKIKEIGGYRWDANIKKWWATCKDWNQVSETTKDLPDGVAHDAVKVSPYEKYRHR